MLSGLAVVIDSLLLFAYFITEHALLFSAIMLALLIACKLNSHFTKSVDSEDSSGNESDRRDVSPIREKEEENNDSDRPSSRLSLGLARSRRLEKDRRTVDWVRDARKICRQLMGMQKRRRPSLISATTSYYKHGYMAVTAIYDSYIFMIRITRY